MSDGIDEKSTRAEEEQSDEKTVGESEIMDSFVEIPALDLDDATSGGNESASNDPPSNNAAVASASTGTKEEKNLIRDGDIGYKSQMKRHTERENEILIGDQVRGESNGPPVKNFRQSLTPPKKETAGKESARKRHLAVEIGNEKCVSSAPEIRRSPRKSGAVQDGFSHCSSSRIPEWKQGKGNEWESDAVRSLRRQNHQLIETLLRIQKNHAAEKKRFYEILFGIDRALSSLPIRLEKIRARNQRNLSVISSSRFHSGSDNPPDLSPGDSTPEDETTTDTSRESQAYLSTRMKSLLQKMDQLNDLIHTIKEGDSSPIELLLNSELYAISLLKKEIKSTKKQIEDSRTDTETVTSCEGSHRELVEDSSSKAKNSFSNELNKASNFKIFENHMMLQEEALNLLTRKIKETEEALVKEVEAKEGLRRENEAMAKEIFRLKSAGEESKGEKSEKAEKLKAEATGNRPYRLVKELKTKLEEKEKSLIAWKSKCSRLEAAGSNKTVLIEKEKKKNFELETVVKNLKSQNKVITSHISSLQFLNEQLRDQMEILKRQLEILATDRMELELNPESRGSRFDKHIAQDQEVEVKKVEKEAENKLKELQNHYENEMEEMRFHLGRSQSRTGEFLETFKSLLLKIHNSAIEREVKRISHPAHDRIREILQLTHLDLQLLYSVYMKSATGKEVEKLFEELKSIVEGENEFAEVLSTWVFDLIREKLLEERANEPEGAEA